MSRIKNVCLIGYGYWGSKLAGKFDDLGVLKVICEQDQERREKGFIAHQTLVSDSCLTALHDASIDAVAIATPPETHYDFAKQALLAGKHVFCEKPLATGAEWPPDSDCFRQASELENLAIDRNLRLQVGHIYLSNTGLLGIPKPYGGAALNIRLLNVAGAPSDSTRELLWAGLPHALSVCVHFLGAYWSYVYAIWGENYLAVEIRYNMQQSACWIQLADHSGIRQRSVHLHADDQDFLFHADKPSQYQVHHPGREKWTPYEKEEKEPLLKEVEDFLSGEVITDRMGSKVAELTDYVICSMKGNEQNAKRTN